MVNDIQAMNPVYIRWYRDDGGIVGVVDPVKKCGICCRRVVLRLAYTSTCEIPVVVARP